MFEEGYLKKMKSEVKSLAFYRDIAVEVVGTFILVAVQIAVVLDPTAGTPNASWVGNIVRIPLGMAMVVMILADGLGPFGGGNFNPAVSVALAINVRITVLRALLYILGQLLGGILAGLFIYGVTPKVDNAHGGFALTMLAPGVTPVQGVFVEAFATSILVFTVLGSTNQNRRDVYMPAIPIGFAVGCALITTIPYTGAGINPSRSFGPALIAHQYMTPQLGNAFKDHWVYWVGPIVGSIIASAIYLMCNKVDGKQVVKQRVWQVETANMRTDKTQL